MQFEDYETFKFERDGRILTVTINRPDHMNAVNATMHSEMASVFYDLQKDRDSDVIILWGQICFLSLEIIRQLVAAAPEVLGTSSDPVNGSSPGLPRRCH